MSDPDFYAAVTVTLTTFPRVGYKKWGKKKGMTNNFIVTHWQSVLLSDLPPKPKLAILHCPMEDCGLL